MTIHELETDFLAKQIALKSRMDGYELKDIGNGKKSPDIPANDIEGIRKQNDELNELGEKLDLLRDAQRNIDRKVQDNVPVNRGGMPSRNEEKNWFSEMWEAGGFKKGAGEFELKDGLGLLERKTTMVTSTGYVPETTRSGLQVDTVQIQPTLLDYMRIIPVNQNSYAFMKETTFTNNAGVKGEGVAYDEAALAVAQTTIAMNRLGVYIPVTDDQLEDEPAANAYIDRRLRDMIRIKMEAQILNGNGTEPQWEGILGLSGIQTVDSASYDSKFDALHLAIMNVMRSDATTYGGGMANLIAMAPADWQDFATTRTADGIYIYGSVVDAVTRRAWGLPVLVNFTITAGTALVLDTTYFPIGIRRDMKVERTNSHGELFIAGTQVIRADIKGNVIPIRDAAAVKVTNI